jgi:hypothetical protein
MELAYVKPPRCAMYAYSNRIHIKYTTCTYYTNDSQSSAHFAASTNKSTAFVTLIAIRHIALLGNQIPWHSISYLVPTALIDQSPDMTRSSMIHPVPHQRYQTNKTSIPMYPILTPIPITIFRCESLYTARCYIAKTVSMHHFASNHLTMGMIRKAFDRSRPVRATCSQINSCFG